MKGIEGKVAIVTGGGSGLGEAIAVVLRRPSARTQRTPKTMSAWWRMR